nr:MAG TPA: hypothetical protein [Caudoviricetes sp.]
MKATTQRIQCGNHPLLPKVAITEIRRHVYADGHLTQVSEQPEIAITCTTYGKTSLTNDIIFETKFAERSYR